MPDTKINLRENPEVVDAVTNFLAAAGAVNCLLDGWDEMADYARRNPEDAVIPDLTGKGAGER